MGKDLYQSHFYNYTSIALLALIPTSLLVSHTPLILPVDAALSFFIPAHAHLGMNLVIDDYLPGAANKPSKAVLWLLTIFCFLGLLNLNVNGDGITESAKRLWKKSNSLHKE